MLKQEEATQLTKPRILVIDDEPLVCKVLCEMLEEEGYDTESASDGIEALKKWVKARIPFDLIVTDLRMPNMDGVAFLKKIEQLGADIPVIILTGHGDLNEAYSLLDDYNISDFLTKPLNRFDRLYFSVRNALEKSRLSKELKSINQELEQRVEQRTLDLRQAKEEAEEARDEAEYANNAKSEFLSRMSHELRTPLNAIMGFSSVLKHKVDSTTPPKTEECLDYILQASHHLLRLIEDIFDMTKAEQDQFDISLESINLDKVIETSLNLVKNQAEEKNIRLHHIHSGLYAFANDFRLQQVLVNVLTNAIKYNQDNGSVTVKTESLANNQLQLSIEDTGVGIDPNDQAAVFAPFSRLTYATQNEIQGSGIGLALTKFLVHHMNGRIGFDRAKKQGTIFWVRLAQSNPTKLKPALEIVQAGSKFVTHSILYIEDDGASRSLMEYILKPYTGLDLITAKSPSEAFEMVRKSQPDLIFIDINLPEISGVEVLKTLKDNPKFHKTKFIALSAAAMPMQIEKALMAGFDQYLTKPFDVQQIHKIIEAL